MSLYKIKGETPANSVDFLMENIFKIFILKNVLKLQE